MMKNLTCITHACSGYSAFLDVRPSLGDHKRIVSSRTSVLTT